MCPRGSGFPKLLFILEVPEPFKTGNAVTDMNSLAVWRKPLWETIYSSDSGEFEWDEMNDPLLESLPWVHGGWLGSPR